MDVVYQRIFQWALNRWRKVAKNESIYRKKTKVSAHALLRYAERIDGYDFDAVEKYLLGLSDKIAEMGGNGKFVDNNILITVKNGHIVSIAKANGSKSHLVYQPLNRERGRRWSF